MKELGTILMHDDRQFFVSVRAITLGDEIIGVYIDDLGHIQKVKRVSLYGELILSALEEISHD